MLSPKSCSDDVLRPFVVIDNSSLSEEQKCVSTLNVTGAKKKFSYSIDFVTMAIINGGAVQLFLPFL